MSFELCEAHGVLMYKIGPGDLQATQDRVDTVLDRMIAAEAKIGVMPELTLNEELLQVWRNALRRRRGRVGELQWLLVGTGDVSDAADTSRASDETPETAPLNAAVLLDAHSGEVLACQAKIHPFNITARVLRRWKLEHLLGEKPVEEWMQPGRQLAVLDGGGVRVAILVCEDLKRAIDFGEHLRSFGVSHILTPIFGRPIKDHRWETQHGEIYSGAIGSIVVVSNSRVMHTILGEDGNTGIAVGPHGAEPLHADSAEEVACFTLMPDGHIVRDGS